MLSAGKTKHAQLQCASVCVCVCVDMLPSPAERDMDIRGHFIGKRKYEPHEHTLKSTRSSVSSNGIAHINAQIRTSQAAQF